MYVPTPYEAQIIAKLHKTRKSIEGHLSRGQGLGTGERPNWRGIDLLDRYNGLRELLIGESGYTPAWKAYCDAPLLAYSHNAYDLFS